VGYILELVIQIVNIDDILIQGLELTVYENKEKLVAQLTQPRERRRFSSLKEIMSNYQFRVEGKGEPYTLLSAVKEAVRSYNGQDTGNRFNGSINGPLTHWFKQGHKLRIYNDGMINANLESGYFIMPIVTGKNSFAELYAELAGTELSFGLPIAVKLAKERAHSTLVKNSKSNSTPY
jgi:hypothetical protein